MKPLILATLGVGLLFGPIVTVDGADLTADEVKAALNAGIHHFQATQHNDGSWSEYTAGAQPGGVTALCALALLNAGQSPQEPHVKKALDFVRRMRPKTTYCVALQTIVLCRAEPERDQIDIGKNVQWLQDTQIKHGLHPGAWSYPGSNPETSGDGSNSQFALLALYEAQLLVEAKRIHVEIDRSTWELAQRYWSKQQNNDGSWSYISAAPGQMLQPGLGSMTCAGIASMIITSDMMEHTDARVVGDKIDCCVRSEMDNSDRVEHGVEWLRQHFSIEDNPNSRGNWHLYYLYALERVGRLTARRFIGLHDWYREGAAYLVHQNPPDSMSGYWKGKGYSEGDNPDVPTALAMLFLSKGRRPVLVAKVKCGEHDLENQWNHRRNDVNNLTMYVEARWKHELSWQVIDIEAASVDDLLQTPVLYWTRGGNPLPPDEQRQQRLAQKLRDYLDRGGFLVAESDCCTTGFDAGFRRLMELVFPEPEYRLKPLDLGHPIWHAEEKVSPDLVPTLYGIDFGCRTSVVYAACDPGHPPLSCLWELSRMGRRQKFAPTVQAQVDSGCALGLNIMTYATNREVQSKDEIPVTQITRDKHDKVDRGRLHIVILRHSGGCDSAPRALANLMEQAVKELHLQADVHPQLINISDQALFDHPIAFMHGRSAFRLTDKERENLKKYIERGGVLFSDAICGNPAFSASFRHEMEAIFPKNPLERIPPRDPIWSTKYDGFDLKLVGRRDPQPGQAGGPLESVLRRVPPELEGIKLGDRWGVIFSQFDLSCALEKHDSLECRGYTREDAAKIGLNVIMYAMQQ